MTMTTTPTTATPAPRFVPPRRFDNAAEWLRALGGVPLERILFDPWPGTATEADLLRLAERDKRLCELIDGTIRQLTSLPGHHHTDDGRRPSCCLPIPRIMCRT